MELKAECFAILLAFISPGAKRYLPLTPLSTRKLSLRNVVSALHRCDIDARLFSVHLDSLIYLSQKENSLFISAESTFMTNFAAAKKRLTDEFDLDSDANPYCADVPVGD